MKNKNGYSANFYTNGFWIIPLILGWSKSVVSLSRPIGIMYTLHITPYINIGFNNLRPKITTNYNDFDGEGFNSQESINTDVELLDNGYKKSVYETNPNGNWSKRTYNENGYETYYEDHTGIWKKREYDENGNETYFENSGGFWKKSEYNKNGKKIYYEDSDGYWEKFEYDESGNEIYYENSNGQIMDNRPQNINEDLDQTKKKYREKIVGNYPDGNGQLTQYWTNGIVKFRHRTFDDGSWYKITYDENEKLIYYESSGGYWIKREYDENGNEIYYEDSNGYWEKWEYDKNENQTYFENSDGYWEKHEYNENGNEIYHENSNGQIMDNRSKNREVENKYPDKISGDYPNPDSSCLKYWENGKTKSYHNISGNSWFKVEFDENENQIYFEDSAGIVIDKRTPIENN